MEFYSNLKKLCKEKKISVTALLEELGFSHSNTTQWKNGKRPRMDIVLKIAERLEVSVDYLLTGQVINHKSLQPQSITNSINIGNDNYYSAFSVNDKILSEKEKEILTIHKKLIDKNKAKLLIFAYDLLETQ